MLETYARLIRKYAEPLLLGDFSQWMAIWEYSVNRSVSDWIQPGRSEFPRFSVADKNGKHKIYGKEQFDEDPSDYIKQLRDAVFKDRLEYIKLLKMGR
ncbi:MAG: hypothetical protein QY332_18140 [Anaerolineales bacterium]|nr:MAG: hypothetical protein QY332_18140 [Anaerolineales bacterium]